MTFLWPILLVLVPLVPIGAVLLLLLGRRRVTGAAGFGQLRLASGQAGRLVVIRRRITTGFFLTGLIMLTAALARPQTTVSLPVHEGTIILSFDVSGSMAADDLEPTRMEAAKAAAKDFVKRQPQSVVIGVIAFSDSGFSVQVPTNDQEAVIAAINRLAPQRGTSLGRGILVSLQAIAQGEADDASGFYTNRTPVPTVEPTAVPAGSHTSAAIVLLTDGENNEPPDPLEAARAAADMGIRIYPIGIGSEGGATLQIEGFTVRSRLDPEMLRQVADLTGGVYYDADSRAELQAIYDELDPRLMLKSQTTEITAILAGFGLIALLIGGLTSLAWNGRLP